MDNKHENLKFKKKEYDKKYYLINKNKIRKLQKEKYNKNKKSDEEIKNNIIEGHKKQAEKIRGIKNPLHSLRMKGKNNPRWKGGISSINQQIRNSNEYKLWRKAVFERDKYTCVWCRVKNGNGKNIYLNADHIKPFADYPELRFAIDNGRTLCRECHKTTNTFGWKYYNKTKNNE